MRTTKTLRTLWMIVFAVLMAGGVLAPAASAGSAGPTQAVTGTAAVDSPVRAFLWRYYAEPAKLTVVGEKITAQCLDYPEQSWGIETEWFTVYRFTVDCPGPL